LDDIATRTQDLADTYGVDVADIRAMVSDNLCGDMADHHRQALAALEEWEADQKANS
jgi:hypothetical protein